MLDTYRFNHIQNKPTNNTIGMMNMRKWDHDWISQHPIFESLKQSDLNVLLGNAAVDDPPARLWLVDTMDARHNASKVGERVDIGFLSYSRRISYGGCGAY